jgi:cobalamin-dependent methionine synthase I
MSSAGTSGQGPLAALTPEALVRVEMQRRQLQMPLLIGGATTSRQHTAIASSGPPSAAAAARRTGPQAPVGFVAVTMCRRVAPLPLA